MYFSKLDSKLVKIKKTILKRLKNSKMEFKLVNTNMKEIWNIVAVNIWCTWP